MMNVHSGSFALEGVRADIRTMVPSLIREVANAGMARSDIVPLWFGEPDQPTPEFIRTAAAKALAEGNTFYQPNAGIIPLRDALSVYNNRLYGTDLQGQNITVTVSGLNALMVAMQLVLTGGDQMVTTSPIWPNITAIPEVLGAQSKTVALTAGHDGWSLDLDALMAACDPNTKAILINSPNNPTGWVMPAQDQEKLVSFATERGIWVIADEVYARLVYDGQEAAPSFARFVSDDRRVIVVNSFSKSWAMTGWRLGWITAPKTLGNEFEKLMEYNVSCPAGFIQQAGIVALQDGEDFIHAARARYKKSRDVMFERLRGMNRVFVPEGAGAFYAFFQIEGVTDSFSFAKDLLAAEGIGLAPGAAFGPDGGSFLRACYAVSEDRVHRAMDGLAKFLQTA